MGQLLPENETWKDWTVEKQIGEGSFGKVYLIKKTDGFNTYRSALKVITIPQNKMVVQSVLNEGMDEKSVTGYFRGIVKDVVNEIKMMSEVKGEASTIVNYEDHQLISYEDDIRWDIFIRMELLTPLNKRINGKLLSVRDALRLGVDICKALEICQKKNIIHRDIKPENIFISELGKFKLGDFGIARQMDGTTTVLSQKGTYTYMAPEVFHKEKYSSNVDIYSLGIVLYRFLNNNRTPFLPEYPAVITAKDREDAENKRLRGCEIPPPCNAEKELADIILKACAYKPEDRFQDASEMKNALEKILNSSTEEELSRPNGDVLMSDTLISDDKKDVTEEDDGGTVHIFPPNDEPEENESDDKNSEPEEKEDDKKSKKAENDLDDDVLSEDRLVKTIFQFILNQKKRIVMGITGLLVMVVIIIEGTNLYPKLTQVTVPDIRNVSMQTAQKLLQSAELKIEEEDAQYSDDIELGNIISQNVKEGTQVKRGSVIKVVVSKGKLVTVPEIFEMEQNEAETVLAKLGLHMEVSKKEYSDDIKKGCIISRNPENETLGEGTTIQVVVSKGIEQVEVPNVKGKKKKSARKLLKEEKLKYKEKFEYSSSVKSGYVIRQSVKSGKTVDKGTTITIVISRGKRPQTTTSTTSSSYSGGSGSSERSTSAPSPTTSAPRPSAPEKSDSDNTDDSDNWDVIN